jgi:hypothetical protein
MDGTPKFLRVKRPAADVKAATIAALRSGGTIDQAASPQIASVRYSGRCTCPVHIEQIGLRHVVGEEPAGLAERPEIQPAQVRGSEEPARTLQMAVQCRRCSWCLQNRGERFAERAVIEFERSSRTWLGTLTLHEQARYRFLAQTRARLDKAGVDLAKLKAQERFVELHHEIGPEVTAYLHRVRKGLRTKGERPVRFRYLLSVEPHLDWIPHYHVLIHEVSPLTPLRKTRLKDHWPYGFTSFKLVTHEAGCHYAAKYLGKFNGGRVRTSLNYGNEVDAESATRLLNKLLLEQQHRISQQIPQKEKLDPSMTPFMRA